MKFKTREELIDRVMDDGYIGGIEDAFYSFAERVEFYKKYYLSPMKLQKEKPKLYYEFLKKVTNEYPELYKGIKDEYDTRFNVLFFDWLFDYCFGDVIE